MDAWTRKPIARFTSDHCKANYEAYDEEMKLAIREIGVRNMMIEKRLQLVLQKLQDKGIPAIIMKGCHLIRTIYPFGIRPIEDIDILLDRKYYAIADEVVCNLGYTSQALGLDVWTHVEISNKVTYINGTHPKIPIDFHFTLGPYPYLGRIPFDVLLAYSERMAVNETIFYILKPEMLLVHLCLHLFQHHDEHWEVSAYDLSAVTTLQTETLNWDRFLTIVKNYALQLPVQYAISKGSTIANIQVPNWVKDKISSCTTTWKERRIFQASLVLNTGMEKHVIQFFTTPSLSVKLQCLRKILFPTKSFLRYYYNRSYLKYIAHMSATAARALRRVFL